MAHKLSKADEFCILPRLFQCPQVYVLQLHQAKTVCSITLFHLLNKFWLILYSLFP